MEKATFGLIGKNISYSFSKKYFTEKFEKLELDGFVYQNFDVQNIEEFKKIISENPQIKGLNVTIPYKEALIPLLDKVSKKAKAIGAVNVIKITKKNKLKGYNSDYYGFKKSIKPLLKSHHKKALILGTGGAAKAICYTLKKLKISYKYVTRDVSKIQGAIGYESLDAETLRDYTILINCTPLGTSPDIEKCPHIPYSYLTSRHLVYDLIYNPEKTEFLKRAQNQGSIIKNGYEMLVLQAEKAWEIWNRE